MRIIITQCPKKDKAYNNMTTNSIHTVLDYSDNPLGFICQGFGRRVLIRPEWCEVLDGGYFDHQDKEAGVTREAPIHTDLPIEDDEALRKGIKYAIIITLISALVIGISYFAH